MEQYKRSFLLLYKTTLIYLTKIINIPTAHFSKKIQYFKSTVIMDWLIIINWTIYSHFQRKHDLLKLTKSRLIIWSKSYWIHVQPQKRRWILLFWLQTSFLHVWGSRGCLIPPYWVNVWNEAIGWNWYILKATIIWAHDHQCQRYSIKLKRVRKISGYEKERIWQPWIYFQIKEA